MDKHKQTRVQREIVPELATKNPDLAHSLNQLESEAQRIFSGYYRGKLPEVTPSQASIAEFLQYIWNPTKRRL